MYGHLTLEEREVVAQRRAAGASLRTIAEEVGRAPGTLSRELKRNRSSNGYYPSAAQRKAAARRRARPLVRKMDRPEVRCFVCDGLKQYWPPDAIAGRAKRLFPDRSRHVSHQTIYTWIKREAAKGRQWQRFLPRSGKKRVEPENRGKIAHAASIAGRPKVVERRGRLGDFEGDTVHGPAGRGGVVTLVDRKSRFTLIEPVDDLKAETVRDAATDALRSVPKKKRKSVTFDNGKEFARHEELAKRTHVKVYFAAPYCSWQRGTNENTNGLIRRFFPKGTDLAHQLAARIHQVQELLNHRPRRCLGYRTPDEVFTGKRRVALEN